jgi:hypothetical protein
MRGMMPGVTRALLLSILLLWSADRSGAAEAACAETLSSGDGAGEGHLIGTQRITATTCLWLQGMFYCLEGSYSVGIYDFGGFEATIDCRDYAWRVL